MTTTMAHDHHRGIENSEAAGTERPTLHGAGSSDLPQPEPGFISLLAGAVILAAFVGFIPVWLGIWAFLFGIFVRVVTGAIILLAQILHLPVF